MPHIVCCQSAAVAANSLQTGISLDVLIVASCPCRRRHVLANGESLSQHAATAAQRALEMAGIAAADVDLIILATSSPDDLFGSACQVPSPF